MLPEVAVWSKTRNITVASALEVASLLMRSGSLPDTITVEGDPEVVCQVAGETEQSAWLSIGNWGHRGDPDLIAFLEGEMICELGQRMHDLCLTAMKPHQMPVERNIYVRSVKAFFLYDDGKHMPLTAMSPGCF